MMPENLLDTFTKDEILDLTAYLFHEAIAITRCFANSRRLRLQRSQVALRARRPQAAHFSEWKTSPLSSLG